MPGTVAAALAGAIEAAFRRRFGQPQRGLIWPGLQAGSVADPVIV